jgi:hypothetical protein
MSFSNILPGNGDGNNGDIFDIFSVEATELGPVPNGRYIGIAEFGEPKTGKTNGTKGYELRFRILEGPFTGRKVWKFCALTARAASISQSILKPLGFTSKADLERPLPPDRFVCELVVTISNDPNTGIPRNDVKSVKVIRVETPKADPFAPGAVSGTPSPAAPPPSPPPNTGGSEGAGNSLFGRNNSSDPLGGLR